MKAYTDIEQSKRLEEILPLESANMSYTWDFEDEQYYINTEKFSNWIVPKYAESAKHKQVIPCWSLAALMDVLDRGALFITPQGWACQSYINFKAITSDYYDNPIDACVALIEKLYEQKLL